MTLLYRLDADAAALSRRLEARAGADPWPGGPIAPGSFAPVITAGREFIAGPRQGRGPRRMVPRIWGVPPPPSAPDPSRGVLRVRNADSPFWIGNLRNSEFRCLVPATMFSLWGAGLDVEGRRIRCRFACRDQRLFAFAGVWKDSEVPTFAILTCKANALVRAQGRDSMPVILPDTREAQDAWLHSGWDRASRLIEPYPAEAMAMREA